MPVSIDPHTEAEIVATLRAAGCVFAEDEARLLIAEASTREELDSSVARRAQGFPLEHLLGWAEFCGLRIKVGAGVFVPRRRTEFLVEQASILLKTRSIAVDLCCGSGAVGTALLIAHPAIELIAADIDPIAVACARRNVEPAGGRVFESNLFAGLPDELRGRVDVVVANAPYVPTDSIRWMPSEARDYEALVALDGGSDGLDIHRRIAAEAQAWLAPGGYVLVETSEMQAPTTAAIFESAGLVALIVSSDEFDATVVVGSSS
jgi:release factor glutamine methyltransferase